MQDLSDDLARVARAVAGRLSQAGHRAWIVGGAPRDLALGLRPREIDMASAAGPEEVQRLFERTIPLGRAFGTVIVHLDGLDVEHTTFRSESGYSDRRRPDEVRFGASVAEDSSRRDFTCNAIYLDPLDGEVADPQGGLADLDAGRLRCVGDARARFAEDALRPLRMARFAAGLGLEPTPETLAAARAEGGGLAHVSRERVLRELEAVLRRAGARRCLELLDTCGLLEPALPGFGALRPPGGAAQGWVERRGRALEALGAAPGTERGLGVLLGPDPRGVWEASLSASESLVEGLRTSRLVRTTLADAWRTAHEVRSASAAPRSARIRWMRRPGFATAVAWLAAWAAAVGEDPAPWEQLARERAALGPAGLEPAPLLAASDLAARGLAPGPRYGELLRELETLQLDGAVSTRAEALAWLARQEA